MYQIKLYLSTQAWFCAFVSNIHSHLYVDEHSEQQTGAQHLVWGYLGMQTEAGINPQPSN